MSSFSISQRRRQIGVRRALGAALGAVLAVVANLTLMTQRELPRMPLWLLAVGAVMLWLLGQLAVLDPARRAAAAPPVEATRSV